MLVSPWLILAVGLATVLGLMVLGRVHAFAALIISAMVVSLLAPGATGEKMVRVAEAFGATVAKIGIVIAMAALVGKAMLESGAADRIVQSALRLFGPQRAAAALCASGFILAIPVFFDTVFYLLVPLAYSLWRQTRKNYLLYLTAIAAGGVITHTLVPPTPGPLYMAPCLKIDLGLMILVGTILGIPVAVLALRVCHLMNRRMPIPMRILSEEASASERLPERLPPLWLSLLPVVLPVVLISGQTAANLWAEAQKAPLPSKSQPTDQGGKTIPLAPTVSSSAASEPGQTQELAKQLHPAEQIAHIAKLIGDANFALLLSAVIAMGTV
ncbi:MAG: SLC13 family permease, partial [Thermoguttaceae bacterium]|nr:SLC13 family permease [Thermoguttaceae bacterium]